MSKYGLDKFYTKKSVVKEVLQYLDLDKFEVIIEPSAGNGSFSDEIKNCIAYDISPEKEGIIKQDFLELNEVFPENTLVVGNPPFGRNGSLAFAFIKKASEFAKTIAFILPKSFKKESAYNKIPLNFHLVKSVDLNDFSFTYEGEEIDIPCVFQIYEKREEYREKTQIKETDLFSFVKKEEANVSVRRVGVYAGKAFLDLEKSKQSHYFIKVDNPEDFVNLVNEIKWIHNNTVGARSISKNELIEAYEKILYENEKG
jgi:hypothetical protein